MTAWTPRIASGSRIAVACLALTLAGCAANLPGPGLTTSSVDAETASTSKPTPQSAAKIAMLLPLSGGTELANIAKSMKQAGEMALFERDNPHIQLIVKDDRGTPDGAREAATQAIQEGAEIVVGPLLSASVMPAASVAQPAQKSIVAFSNDTRVAGNGVYLMSFLIEQDIERIVSFAASQGKLRFAALIPDNAYGRVVEAAFRSSVDRAGGSIHTLEIYPLKATGMLPHVKRVGETITAAAAAGAPIDALFLPGGEETLPHLAPLLAYAGIDPKSTKLIGTGAWDYPGIERNAAFAGGWYPGPDPAAWKDFAERFTRTFGSPPPRLASLAFDAVGLAISLSSAPAVERFTAAGLTRPTPYIGVDGPTRFSTSGLPERSLAILEVQQYGAAMIDPPKVPSGSTQLSAAANPPVR
jgi:branched-chain amino acid transport system substrate-binding protein